MPDVRAVGDEGRSFHLRIHVHGTVLVELVAKVGCMCDPGKISTIQLDGCRIHWILYLRAAHIKALSL